MSDRNEKVACIRLCNNHADYFIKYDLNDEIYILGPHSEFDNTYPNSLVFRVVSPRSPKLQLCLYYVITKNNDSFDIVMFHMRNGRKVMEVKNTGEVVEN
jgi:hypothetical protein